MKIAKENLKLENIEWGEFKIGEIFNIYTGALINQVKIKQGKIPRITATELNNGIAFFTSDLEDKNFRTLENFISISFLGSVFYQSKRVSLDMKIHGIKLKDKELNYYLALFLIPIIKKFTFKYSYGYQLSTSVLKNQKLLLPLDFSGEPNWQFMEDYMKAIEKEHLEKITAYYNAKLNENNRGGGFDLDEYKKFIQNQKQLENIEWREFYFSDIFKEIKRGKRLIKDNQIQGKIPYVSSSSFNNGVDNFINNNKNIRKFNYCISLANSGSVGSAFFHSY
ncbi:restriction endonuclease subunit S, partial [Campylobacter jejuni]|nr:restriction endonuclease subunit S [Campylobacter jejuni]